jgi:hypothetical protein
MIPLKPEQQFARLVARADEFAAIAAWDESFALREAALLVNPDDVEQRKLMIRHAYEWCSRVYLRIQSKRNGAEHLYQESTRKPLTDWHKVDPALAAEMDAVGATFESLWVRSLEHMEWLARRLRDHDVSLDYDLARIGGMVWEMAIYQTGGNDAVAAVVDSHEKRYHQALRELGPILAGPPVTAAARERAWIFVGWEVFRRGMAARSNQARVAEALENMADGPDLWRAVVSQLERIPLLPDDPNLRRPTSEEDYPEFVAVLLKSRRKSMVFLGRFGQLWIDDKEEGLRNPRRELRDRAEALEKELNGLVEEDPRWKQVTFDIFRTDGLAHLANSLGDAGNDSRAPNVIRQAPLSQRAGPISYQLVPLHVSTPDGKNPLLQYWNNSQFPLPPNELTFLPCGEGVDVVWNRYAVFLHRKAGLLEPVLVDPKEQARDVAWDGRQIWVATGLQGIQILDRAGKVIGHLNADQGLPPADRKVLIRVLAPGRIFVCGSFGDDHRAWFAVAERAAAGTLSVNVFHCATALVDPHSSQIREARSADTNACFSPVWLAGAPPGPDSPAGAIWIRRDIDSRHLLRVDLGNLKVAAVSFENISYLSPVRPPTFIDSERALAFRDQRLFEVSFSGKPLKNGKLWRFVFGDTCEAGSPIQLLPIEGRWYLPGPEWFSFDLTTLTAQRLGPGAKWGGIRMAGDDIGYCQSSVSGLIGWNTYATDFVQISLDSSHPLSTRADASFGPSEQFSAPRRSNGRLLQYPRGDIIMVNPQRREFYSGRGCLVVLDNDQQRRFGIIEPELYRAKAEAEWLELIGRTLEYPEEQQRLRLSTQQVESLKQLPRGFHGYFNADSEKSAPVRPTLLGKLRSWTDEAKFRALDEAYDKATGAEKQSALDALFAAVREAGEERQRLAERTIAEIKKILTPAQVKAIRFDPP